MKAIVSFVLTLLLAGIAEAAPIEGFWSGMAVRGGDATPVTLHIERERGALVAHYNIPALSLAGMPLAKFTFDPATGAITTSRLFNGRLLEDAITGELHPALLHGPPVKVQLRREAHPPSLATRERRVEFKSRGNILRGLLVTPRRHGRHPALVSLHGSGPSTRWLALDRARRFAEAGYAMLIFDKPGSGESHGDWTMTSLDEMAQDAIAAVDFVRAQPEVVPGKVGVWGHSQAGWVISRAAAMPNDIAFAIVLAGGGATSREVEDYGYLVRLKHANASAGATAKAMSWVNRYFEYVRSGEGYAELTGTLKNAAGEEWVKALGIDTVYPTPEQQPKWQWVATYDPMADIRRIRIPVLLLFAEKDESSPSERSLARWREGLAQAGTRSVEWKMFADAEHHFLTPPHTGGWPSLAAGYYETQIDWLTRVVGR